MIEAATIALKFVNYAAEQAARAQAANAPDWAKWLVNGAYVMSQLAEAGLKQQNEGTDIFDNMTPPEIRKYLGTPPTWEEL